MLDQETIFTIILHLSFSSQIVCVYILHYILDLLVLHLVLLNEESLEPDAVLSLTCSIKTILGGFHFALYKTHKILQFLSAQGQ